MVAGHGVDYIFGLAAQRAWCTVSAYEVALDELKVWPAAAAGADRMRGFAACPRTPPGRWSRANGVSSPGWKATARAASTRATSSPRSAASPARLYEAVSCARGQAENLHQADAQGPTRLDRTSCQSAGELANQFRLDLQTPRHYVADARPCGSHAVPRRMPLAWAEFATASGRACSRSAPASWSKQAARIRTATSASACPAITQAIAFGTASLAACGPPVPGRATPGCSPPAPRPPEPALVPREQHQAAVRQINPPKSADTFLRLAAGRSNGSRVSSVMAGVALSLSREKCAWQRISTRSQRVTPCPPSHRRAVLNKWG